MAKQSNAAPPNQITMIGEGTTFDGTLQAESDVRISGRVMGKINVSGKIIVAQGGVIEGEIKADSLDVAGRIQGGIDVSERVILKSSAEIEGDIHTGRLVVEEGAVFNGQCRTGGRTMKSGQILPAPQPQDIPRPKKMTPEAISGGRK